MTSSSLPAEPTLASALWRVKQAESPPAHLLTGCAPIDATLLPGLPYGQGGLCCISAEDGTAAQELLNTLLTSHLTSTSGKATIIDPVGFDIALLAQHISSLQPPEQSTSILSRISLTRVFTIQGLLSTLSDLRLSLSASIPDSQPSPEAIPISSPTTGTPPTHHDDHASTTRVGGQHLLLLPSLPALLAASPATHASATAAALARSLRHITSLGAVCVATCPATTQARRAADGPGKAGWSIFASCAVGPHHALPLRLVDVGLLVHRVPKGVGDAEMRFAAEGGREEGREVVNGIGVPGGKKGGGGRMVDCFEVLRDACGARRGRYGFFEGDGRGGVRSVVW